MRIRLLVGRASWANGKTVMQNPGEIIEVSTDEAMRMIAKDQAVSVEVKPVPVESAMEEIVSTPQRGRLKKLVETRNA